MNNSYEVNIIKTYEIVHKSNDCNLICSICNTPIPVSKPYFLIHTTGFNNVDRLCSEECVNMSIFMGI